MVLSILAGVVALALLITLLTTPVYQASVLLGLQEGHASRTGGAFSPDFERRLGSEFCKRNTGSSRANRWPSVWRMNSTWIGRLWVI